MSDPPALRVLVAPDAFKGSLSARDAADAMAAGLADALGASARIERLPLADGGEGTLDALLALDGATERRTPTTDAIGRPRAARWGLLPDATAVVEAAEANGLPLVSDVALRPLEADSAGVGLLLRAALEGGATSVLLTVGGSATTDGGAGLL
ncbi:MAG: glycerate kinase, partial [Microcella sp.]|uniref:glycerate kinase n=1 Tax=Microcella sp. TaxID=1913979 RepID=UPI00271E5E12